MSSNSLNDLRAVYFKALGHPTRLKIIEFLREGEKCVCEIIPALQMEQSNISRHLAILKKEGILSCRKEGLKVIYWVSDPRVFQLLELSREMLRYHLKAKTLAV